MIGNNFSIYGGITKTLVSEMDKNNRKERKTCLVEDSNPLLIKQDDPLDNNFLNGSTTVSTSSTSSSAHRSIKCLTNSDSAQHHCLPLGTSLGTGNCSSIDCDTNSDDIIQPNGQITHTVHLSQDATDDELYANKHKIRELIEKGGTTH